MPVLWDCCEAESQDPLHFGSTLSSPMWKYM